MEFDQPVGLEMHALGVVGRQEAEGLVQAVRVARKREGQMGEVVDVYLRLIDH